MNTPEIETYLTHLAVDQKVAASTQNQALAALLFLYQQVLHQPLAYPVDAVRAKKSRPLPVVISKNEVTRLNGSREWGWQYVFPPHKRYGLDKAIS